MLTYKKLQDEVLRRVDEAGAASTDTVRLVVKQILNEVHALRCAEYERAFLLFPVEATITTVVDQKDYPLHPSFDRGWYFFNTTTKKPMTEVPERNFLDIHTWQHEATGSAHYFTFGPSVHVKNQPSSASVVRIVSSSASDNSATYNVVVKGVSSGELKAEVITPNGTSSVDGTVSFTTVLSISKASPWNGTLTATSNSGVVTLLTLDACEMGKDYRQLRLFAAPTSAETITYRFFRKPLLLINDYDVPDVPYPYSNILIYDALLQLGTYNMEVARKDVELWLSQQARWEKALDRAFIEQQTLGALPQQIHDVEGFTYNSGFPMVNGGFW